jgi:hydroxyethylthiazole kinase
VLVISGPVDYLVSGQMIVSIANGYRLMSTVTGIGCAAGALTAAFAAACPDRVRAAASSTAVIGVAGELAGKKAAGPGSFQASFLDALYALDTGLLDATVRLQTLCGE